MFLYVYSLLKVLQFANPDSMLWKLHQKANFRLFRRRQLAFQNREKDKNLDFMEIFHFRSLTSL